jgi:hypothetical protein
MGGAESGVHRSEPGPAVVSDRIPKNMPRKRLLATAILPTNGCAQASSSPTAAEIPLASIVTSWRA